MEAGVAPDPALERSFRGHRDGVNAVVFNPNMRQLVTGSEDASVMIWHFRPNLRAFRFIGHKSAVLSIAISPDGGLIASGSKDRTVRLWLPTVKGESTTIRAHGGAVRCVRFSTDGDSLLSASDDKSVKVWSVSGQRFKFSLTGHSNWVRTAEFSPDGRLVASGGDDKTVKLWDTGGRTCIHTFYDHSAQVTAVRFHPDGNCLASASEDRAIRLWDSRAPELRLELQSRATALTSGLTQTIRVAPSSVGGGWLSHAGTFVLLQQYDAHPAPVSDIQFHPSKSEGGHAPPGLAWYRLAVALPSPAQPWSSLLQPEHRRRRPARPLLRASQSAVSAAPSHR